MSDYLVTYSYKEKSLNTGFGEVEFNNIEKLTISSINEMRSKIIEQYNYQSVVFLNIIKLDSYF